MTTLTDLTKAITRAKYRVQPAQLESLAKLHWANSSGVAALSGTYLRCLVAAVRATTGAGDDKDHILQTIDSTHAEYMPHLEAGVITADIADNERLPQEERTRRITEKHRRTTFARTSKADLRAYIASGGALGDLDPTTVTRTQLREFAKGVRPKGNRPPVDLHAATKTGRQLEARVLSAFGTAIEHVGKLATVKGEEVDLIVDLIEDLHSQLTELADKLGREFSKDARIPQLPVQRGERRGEMRLWPEQSPSH